MINSEFFSSKIYFKNNLLTPKLESNKGSLCTSALTSDVFIKSAKVNKAFIPFGSSINSNEILNKMNSQLIDISTKDIDKIIEEFPAEDKKLVLSILQRATQFGKIDSLNSIYDSIMIEKSKGYGCFSFTEPRINSLIETFSYLTAKKAFQKDPAEPIDMDL